MTAEELRSGKLPRTASDKYNGSGVAIGLSQKQRSDLSRGALRALKLKRNERISLKRLRSLASTTYFDIGSEAAIGLSRDAQFEEKIEKNKSEAPFGRTARKVAISI